LGYLLVILHAHERIESGVGPPEVHQDLAAPPLKAGEVGVGGVENLVDAFEARRIVVQVELAQIVLWVGLAKSQVAEEGFAEGRIRGGAGVADEPWVPAAAAVGAGDFGAHRPARKDALALAHHVAVDLLERADLARREAAGLVAAVALGKIARGIEAAAARVVDHAVLEPVPGIALRVDLF